MATTSHKERLEELRRLSTEIRKRSLRMVHAAGMGHPGGDLSAADILVTLYFEILRIDPRLPHSPDRDRFIMSKGHCTGAFYAVLAARGFFPEKELDSYMKPRSRLNGHPDRTKIPGVEANTGPLGHGLPVAVGNAIAAKINKAKWRTYALVGDGELQEGSNWEAAMAASNYSLDNLTLIVDRNGLQLGSATEETMRLEPLIDKFQAFGWTVSKVSGHEHGALMDTLRAVPFSEGRPSCLIAITHKGQGVSFARDNPEWHHHVPTDKELARALKELG